MCGDPIRECAARGRVEELRDVTRAFGDATKRTPFLLVIRGDRGVGKTRLAQDFFAWLSRTGDVTNYWPERIGVATRTDSLVPVVERDDPEKLSLPWLWLATRGTDSTSRESSFHPVALEDIRRQMRVHIAGVIRAQEQRSTGRALAKATAASIASFVFPGAPQLVAAVQNAVAGGLTVWDQIDAAQTYFDSKRSEYPAEFLAHREQRSLTLQAIEAFSGVLGRSRLDRPIPTVLVIDDVQFLDRLTSSVLTELVQSGWERGWPLLIIAIERVESAHEPFSPTVGAALEISGLPTRTIYLEPLDELTLAGIVRSELPNLDRKAARVLARRSSGDVELLREWTAELQGVPGWLDDQGRLTVDIGALDLMPSTASAMARSRIRAIGQELSTLLAVGSTEGNVFHTGVIKGAATRVLDKGVRTEEAIADSDRKFKITNATLHPQLGTRVEFRRRAYSDICREIARRLAKQHPGMMLAVAESIRHIALAPVWDSLERNERGKLGERLLELMAELNLMGEDWRGARNVLTLDVARIRLDMGDAETAGKMASEAISNTALSPEIKSEAFEILVTARFMEGNLEAERCALKDWTTSTRGEDSRALLRAASFHVRQSEPIIAIREASAAVAGSPPESLEYRLAATCLSHAMWSSGDARGAIEVLAQAEAVEPTSSSVDVDHVGALVLHDLERNLRVIDHAERCVSEYRRSGRIEAEIISLVNLGDAEWGAGRVERAQTTLEYALGLSVEADLPHAEDIAAICLANVLAVQGRRLEADQLYDRGVALAARIGHRWDELYGRIYRSLFLAECGGTGENLMDIAKECEWAGYGYLVALARAYAAVSAWYAEDRGHASHVLKAVGEDPIFSNFPGPAVHVAALSVLIDRQSDAQRRRFLRELGRCEGVKGRSTLVMQAIDVVYADASLIESEFLDRWRARFSTSLRPLDESDPRLKVCDYRTCEARCCYDGVYLEHGDREKIEAAMSLEPEIFVHVPEDPLVVGDWGGSSGLKTATRPHQYKSPDFPDHFNHTRCVFALSDGACSLQVAATKRGEPAWTYKPTGCWMHPLNRSNVGAVPPPLPGERDVHFKGFRYPGYTAFTPCGQHREDGRPWRDMLAAEVRRIEGE